MQAYVEYFQTHGQEYVHMIWQHLYLSLWQWESQLR